MDGDGAQRRNPVRGGIVARAGIVIGRFAPVSLFAPRLPDTFFTTMTFRIPLVVAAAAAILSVRKLAGPACRAARASGRRCTCDPNRSRHDSSVI
ncbi:hypothetical protein GQ56_0117815 [Burkholderia paludis]|uniref:hypothetical protein n=1 Tax=Burkholderia paludis TaxID=1506587 RepID=UPI0004DB7368|nr:hypothetical protein [Burkholderia paludis]KFG96017.1 hypothetical protein GQ56_0117815 [Burkholderia paludis]